MNKSIPDQESRAADLAKTATSFSGYLSTQPADKPIDFDSDEPIAAGKACDLTGDGACEACQ